MEEEKKSTFSEAQIQQYKKDHGRIFRYRSDDGKEAILKSPSLQTIDACRAISNRSPLKFDQALAENCWVDGDKELLTVDKYRAGLYDWLASIIDKVSGQLEEL